MTGRVLIIEESLTVRMNLQEALAAAGMEVESGATLTDGRRALASRDFGLVVLDMQLADGDGTDLLREIRRSPAQRDTRVMVLADEAEVCDRLRDASIVADACIGKPYDLGQLITRVRELLALPPAGTALPDDRGEAPVVSPTVLIIDDSLTFRVALKEALEKASYRVLTAESGEAGLRLAARLRPSALIVDGVMDGIDGATVIRRVRLDAALRHMPCLLLTASEGESGEIEALEAGADAYAIKSEDASLVLARLSAILRSSAVSGRHSTPSLQAPKRVLAVDDSETYLQELAGSMRAEGYSVVLARSGEEALDLIARQPVDCVLLDLVMPGLGGHEVCRRLKSNPLTRDIPVLILTARGDQESIIEGLNAGADDYIAKSSEFQVLRARVLAQLRRKQFEDENRHIREQVLHRELEATEARAARELTEARAALIEQERRRAEAEERSGAQLAAAIADGLHAPLQEVAAHLERLLATALNSEQRQIAEAIRGCSTRLQNVASGLLTSSPLASAAEPALAPFSLVEVIERVAVRGADHPAAAMCLVDPAIDEWVIGDAALLESLLAAAVASVGGGEPARIEAIAETFTPEQVTVLLEITGCAAPDTDAAAQERDLAQRLGGQAGRRSAAGMSTIWFRFDFARSHRPESNRDYGALLARLRILVFAPVAPVAETLYLRAKEVRVVECADADAAASLLAQAAADQQPFDLVLLHAPPGAGDAIRLALHGVRLLRVGSETAGADGDMLAAPVRRSELYDRVARITGRL